MQTEPVQLPKSEDHQKELIFSSPSGHFAWGFATGPGQNNLLELFDHRSKVMCAARLGGRFGSTAQILNSLKVLEKKNRRQSGFEEVLSVLRR